MQLTKERPASGHLFRVKRNKGDMWFAKYRLPDGRQVKRTHRPGPRRPESNKLLTELYGIFKRACLDRECRCVVESPRVVRVSDERGTTCADGWH